LRENLAKDVRLNHANMIIVIEDLKGGKIILFYHGAF